jgi:hypothetical protein
VKPRNPKHFLFLSLSHLHLIGASHCFEREKNILEQFLGLRYGNSDKKNQTSEPVQWSGTVGPVKAHSPIRRRNGPLRDPIPGSKVSLEEALHFSNIFFHSFVVLFETPLRFGFDLFGVLWECM